VYVFICLNIDFIFAEIEVGQLSRLKLLQMHSELKNIRYQIWFLINCQLSGYFYRDFFFFFRYIAQINTNALCMQLFCQIMLAKNKKVDKHIYTTYKIWYMANRRKGSAYIFI